MACAPLEMAVADLRPLMSSANQTVRNMTYMLLLRYLKDNPNAAADLLPDYLDCLDNRNAAVVTTALERLPDFLLLCQGKSFSQTVICQLVLTIYRFFNGRKRRCFAPESLQSSCREWIQHFS